MEGVDGVCGLFFFYMMGAAERGMYEYDEETLKKKKEPQAFCFM